MVRRRSRTASARFSVRSEWAIAAKCFSSVDSGLPGPRLSESRRLREKVCSCGTFPS